MRSLCRANVLPFFIKWPSLDGLTFDKLLGDSPHLIKNFFSAVLPTEPVRAVLDLKYLSVRKWFPIFLACVTAF
jgi:hypothetical protein